MKRLAIIVHFLVLFGLCGSLYKNWCHAKEYSEGIEIAYALGKTDGILWAREMIVRAMIEEQEAKAAKGKL